METVPPVRAALAAAAVLVLAAAGGCGLGAPMNPSFTLSGAEAREALEVMELEPARLERPVLVLGGIHDPGIAAPRLVRKLRRISDGREPIIGVSFFGANTFEACRQRVMRVMQETVPSDEEGWTVEVDVVGISMGGLVARYAQREPPDGGRRLRVKRLFTIATPHRGAVLARLPSIDARVRDMKPGSAFLAALDAEPEPAEEIHAYVRLDDAIVGARHADLAGHPFWWMPNKAFDLSHLRASSDLRIVADVASRLRGEGGFGVPPPAPLPGRKPDSPESADSEARDRP